MPPILAAPERRGAVVGTVMSGVLCGILLIRTLSGFVAAHEGWRAMFRLGVPLALGAGGLMAVALPRSLPEGRSTYAGLLVSLVHLWREFRELRLAPFLGDLRILGIDRGAGDRLYSARLRGPERARLLAAIATLVPLRAVLHRR